MTSKVRLEEFFDPIESPPEPSEFDLEGKWQDILFYLFFILAALGYLLISTYLFSLKKLGSPDEMETLPKLFLHFGALGLGQLAFAVEFSDLRESYLRDTLLASVFIVFAVVFMLGWNVYMGEVQWEYITDPSRWAIFITPLVSSLVLPAILVWTMWDQYQSKNRPPKEPVDMVSATLVPPQSEPTPVTVKNEILFYIPLGESYDVDITSYSQPFGEGIHAYHLCRWDSETERYELLVHPRRRFTFCDDSGEVVYIYFERPFVGYREAMRESGGY